VVCRFVSSESELQVQTFRYFASSACVLHRGNSCMTCAVTVLLTNRLALQLFRHRNLPESDATNCYNTWVETNSIKRLRRYTTQKRLSHLWIIARGSTAHTSPK
jgi:hypothetical protein